MGNLKRKFQKIYSDEKRFLFTVYSLALLIRLFFIMYNYSVYMPDGGEQERIAYNLLAGKGFSLTAYWTTATGGPTAAVPPFYPYFLALMFKLFPAGGHLVVQFVQAIASSLICISGYFIAKSIFNREIARLSALLMCFSIFLVKAPLMISRTVFFILLLSLALLSTLKLAQEAGFWQWMGYGLLVGATALNSQEIFIFLPFALGWVVYHNPAGWKVKLQGLCLTLTVMLLLISPWLVRNYIVFQRFVPLVSSFGINLWEGNNPNASGSNYLYPRGRWELDNSLKLRMTPLMNEVERSQVMRQAALEFIRQHPRRFVYLRAKSFFYFWFSHYNLEELQGYPRNIVTLVATLIMNLLAFVGMVLCYRRFSGAMLLVLLFVGFSFVYTLTHAHVIYRYRLPLDPYLLMFAAVSLEAAYVKLSPYVIRAPRR